MKHIAHYLLDELHAVCPGADFSGRPPPRVVTMPLPAVVPFDEAEVIPITKGQRRREQRRRMHISKAIVIVLRERPGSTIRDIYLTLSRRKHRFTAARPEDSIAIALRSLEQRGVVRGHRLSPREAEAAGGYALWEVVGTEEVAA